MAAPLLLLLLLTALLAPSAARPPAAKASAPPTVEVRVGVLLPERNLSLSYAWPRVAPALSLALEALQLQLSLDGISVRTAFASSEDKEGKCDEEVLPFLAEDLLCSHDLDLDVLLGMSCFDYSYLADAFAVYWGLPILRAGPEPQYPTLFGQMYAGPVGYHSLAAFQKRLLQAFDWTRPAIINLDSNDKECWRYDYAPSHPYEAPEEAVRFIQTQARVAFICLPLEDLHQIMLLAHAQNMTNGDYVFFYMNILGESLRAEGHRKATKPWQSNETQDSGVLREAFQTVLVITAHEPQTPEYRGFENELVHRAQRDFGVALNDSLGHLVAGCYHDGLLLYLRALNETLREGGTKRDTSRILGKMRSLKFQGITGTVSINSNNYREMDFDVWAMRDMETGEYQVVGHYIASEDRINWTGDILWKKGGPPLHNPLCVYNMDDPSCVKPKYPRERELLWRPEFWQLTHG